MDFGFFAFRHGRHLEHETKGNRNYQTFGFGLGAFGFTLDYMFLKDKDNEYLDNIWSFTIGYAHKLNHDFFRF